jgi:beta-fructofuranosidase
LTARSRDGAADQRGVIGHALSQDLVHWEARPPLSRPGAGFGQLEVPQVEVVQGRPVLVFSCLTEQLSDERRKAGARGGIWCLPCDSLLGPFDISRAVRIADESLYSGRLIRDRAGQWVILAFRNHEPDRGFIGEIINPVPVRWTQDGTALVAGSATQPRTGGLAGRPRWRPDRRECAPWTS